MSVFSDNASRASGRVLPSSPRQQPGKVLGGCIPAFHWKISQNIFRQMSVLNCWISPYCRLARLAHSFLMPTAVNQEAAQNAARGSLHFHSWWIHADQLRGQLSPGVTLACGFVLLFALSGWQYTCVSCLNPE